jgi:hypothetical protein
MGRRAATERPPYTNKEVADALIEAKRLAERMKDPRALVDNVDAWDTDAWSSVILDWAPDLAGYREDGQRIELDRATVKLYILFACYSVGLARGALAYDGESIPPRANAVGTFSMMRAIPRFAAILEDLDTRSSRQRIMDIPDDRTPGGARLRNSLATLFSRRLLRKYPCLAVIGLYRPNASPPGPGAPTTRSVPSDPLVDRSARGSLLACRQG